MTDELSFWKIFHRQGRHGQGDSQHKQDWLNMHPEDIEIDSHDVSSMISILKFVEHWRDPYARYEVARNCHDILSNTHLNWDISELLVKLSQDAFH